MYLYGVQSFLRILFYIKSYWWAGVLNILFNIFSIVFSLVSILMLIPFLELLFDRTPLVIDAPLFSINPSYIKEQFYYLMSRQIEQDKGQALLFFCIVVVVVFLLKNLFRYLALYMMTFIRNGIVYDLRDKMYQHLLQLPISFFTKGRKGDIITRMTTDLQQIEHSVMSTLEVSFREPITIIVFLIAMLSISPQLTVFIFLMLLVTGVIIGQVGKSLKRQSTEGQEQLGIITSLIDETIEGLRIIKASGTSEYLKNKFEKHNQKHFNLVNKMLRKHDLSSPLTESMGIGIVCVVLWYGGSVVLRNMTDGVPVGLMPETFIGFMVIFSQLIAPAKSFSTAFYKIRKGLASSDRIHEILDTTVEVDNEGSVLSKSTFDKDIVFDDVSFAYENWDDAKALKGINLQITKNKIIAIVGQSGAGKSTLVDLLSRFYDPQQGTISIDGKDIRSYCLADLRGLIGIVTQEPILFNDTVYNNIAFGLKDVDVLKVEVAAKVANAHDFICRLAEGYNTNIGDRGNKLSGGERQRLTIARAVLQNPDILILDEATSSLDSESEKLVQDAMMQLMKNRTSFVIAHRLSTIQFVDEIIVMHEGEIIERGNHISLMAKNGHYKKLVDLQVI